MTLILFGIRFDFSFFGMFRFLFDKVIFPNRFYRFYCILYKENKIIIILDKFYCKLKIKITVIKLFFFLYVINKLIVILLKTNVKFDIYFFFIFLIFWTSEGKYNKYSFNLMNWKVLPTIYDKILYNVTNYLHFFWRFYFSELLSIFYCHHSGKRKMSDIMRLKRKLSKFSITGKGFRVAVLRRVFFLAVINYTSMSSCLNMRIKWIFKRSSWKN